MTEQATSVRRALLAIEKLQARLDQETRWKSEPVAIIGMSCRVPGAVGPEGFWQLLEDRVDTVTEVPADRWPSGDGPARWGAFVSDVDKFDPEFFGIAPREAEAMDPQQRMLLEVGWEALESAGQPPDRLTGSRTGVFAGVVVNDYDTLSTGNRDIYTVTGNGHSFPAGRLSYVLGLEGPSMVVDTACSSSLTAVHLACQSVRSGESTMALAGGVNLILASDMTDMLAGSGALSADGRCKTFDALANGYVRGEGCGMLVLKRLSDAVEAGDPVLAVIRGSAVNSDGRSAGLTAPNVSAQKALLRQALRGARAEPADIGYVETHGTGTPLGDPIEVEALTEVLGAPRPDGTRCVLGAVKTNIGHLEAAAGVIGLIKVVLAMRHERIPANLHLRTVNPRITLAGTSLALAEEPVPWPREEGGPGRMAGVSSFGISGTNAHVILAEAPVPEPAASTPDGPVLVPVSARDGEALTDLVSAYRDRLAADPAAAADIAYTAATRRQHHQHRAALLVAGQQQPRVIRAAVHREPPRVVFVFPGQGSQWLGMARTFLAGEPAFRAELAECDHVIRDETGWSVLDELLAEPESSRLDRIDVVQPVLFAIQVALAALWRDKGVRPDLVIGHSMGEVAAAHVAGALTLPDAAAVVCRRARLLRGLTGRGAMAVVELSLEQARAALSGAADQVCVAASNSARSTVLSGDPATLARILADLTEQGVFCKQIKVDVASHSPQIEPITAELARELDGITPRATSVAMWSTVLDQLCTGTELDASYWVRNLRDPVLFAQAVAEAGRDAVFVELSPHPILLPAITEDGGTAAPSARRDQDDRAVLLEAMGVLYTNGFRVDWQAMHQNGGRCVPLPAYPWRRARYWTGMAEPVPTTPGHPLLGQAVHPASAPDTRIWERALRLPYLSDHRIDGTVVFPAAGYVEMALGTAEVPATVSDVSFDHMAILDRDGSGTVQLAGEADRFQVFSRVGDDGEWVRCAHGFVQPATTPAAPAEAPVQVRARCRTELSAPEHYERYGRRTIEYGPAFRAVERMWLGDGEGVGRVVLDRKPDGYVCHPAMLDGCFQVLGALLLDRPGGAVVPTHIERLTVHRSPGSQVWVHARARPAANTGDLVVLGDDGAVLIEVEGMTVTPLADPDPCADFFYRVVWRPAELPETSAEGTDSGGTWLLLTDSGGVGAELARSLERIGHRCAVVGADEIDPVDDVAWNGLLERTLGDGRTCAGIVHLWSLDSTANDRTTADTLTADQRTTSLGVVYLTRALSRLRVPDDARLYLVTRGAQRIGDEPVAVAQAPLWGLARTLNVEHPELDCTRVDLVADATETDAARGLLAELLGGDGADEIALRPEGRQVARLVRAAVDASSGRLPVGSGTYLITGGLGGLGIGLARWLAGRGARHLVLLGRSAPAPEAKAEVDELRSAGVEVVVANADVSDHADLARVFARIDDRMPPLRGVVHAAMVLDDRTVLDLDAERFARVMAPKMRGAWNLHVLTGDRPLDFFVLYSSAATLLGSPGQANYAAANAFLGSLAEYRAAIGLPALCVDWGLYARAGIMAGRDDDGQRLAHRGVGTLTPEQGVEILERLLLGDTTRIAAANLDLSRWLSFYPAIAGSSLFAEVRADRPADMSDVDEELCRRLRTAAPAERLALLENLVAEQLGRILHLDPERIDRAAPFPTVGVDSLMALELRNRLESALGVRLSATISFAAPTVRAAAEYLLGKLGTDERPDTTGELDDLGVDELLSSIDQSIERIEGAQS